MRLFVLDVVGGYLATAVKRVAPRKVGGPGGRAGDGQTQWNLGNFLIWEKYKSVYGMFTLAKNWDRRFYWQNYKRFFI
jgi:hypothetical protein